MIGLGGMYVDVCPRDGAAEFLEVHLTQVGIDVVKQGIYPVSFIGQEGDDVLVAPKP